jgi:hypothetical protein
MPTLYAAYGPFVGMGMVAFQTTLRIRRRPARRAARALRIAFALVLGIGVARASAATPGEANKLRTYPSRYHIIHTDLDPNDVRDVALRMSAMAEEYQRRTQGFAGKIRQKLPFYVFRKKEDYVAAGGPPDTGGVFQGDRLMAIAGEQVSGWTWGVIQHEGFHQFVRHVIGGDIPTWINEGMAEYFEEARFTGDGFVVGLVHPSRLARLKKAIESAQTIALGDMLALGHQEWKEHPKRRQNYDHAWSLIHFFVHAEDGKYVGALNGFLKDVGWCRLAYEQAWEKHFGSNVDAFEAKWREYWLAQPSHPTAELYGKALVATLTSFLARAVAQRQSFSDPEQFFEAARAGKLKAHKADWLPPSLLTDAVKVAERWGRWSIRQNRTSLPQLILRMRDGTVLTGQFRLRRGRVTSVTVDVSVAAERATPSSNSP